MAEPAELRHVHRHYEVRRFASKEEWERYATWLRRHARVSLALLPEPPRCRLRAKVFDRWEGDGYTSEKVYFESLPGVYVTGNLFRPAGGKRGRAPGILSPHGHWPDGRLHDRDPRGSIIARCIQLARMGAVVFSWDMVGMNDSVQLPHRELGSDPHWGLSLMALQAWNGVRSLDFLLTLPGVDPRRIGVTGCSGGGTQTFTLMAVEERLAAAAPICMISLHMQGGCLCENAPLLRLDATNVELARLFCPKPAFIGSCTGDWTKNTPEEEFPAVRDVYDLFGARDRLLGLHVDDAHNYNVELRQAVYGFFNRWFFGAKSAGPVPEKDARRPPHPKRLVWWGRPAPKAMPFRTLQRIWRERGEAALRPHLRSASSAKKGLGPLLPHLFGVGLPEPPGGIEVTAEGDSFIVAPSGRAKDRSGEVNFFTTYNRSFVADRVHEILAAVRDAPARVRLVGRKEAGLWCLLAGALSKRVGALDVDMRKFDPSRDASWKRHLDTPAIRQIGGLATVFALVGSRPVELRNATDAVRKLARKYAR